MLYTGGSVRRRAGIISVIGTAAAAVAFTNGPAQAQSLAADVDNIVPIPHGAVLYGCGVGGLSICLSDNSKVTYYMDSRGEFKLESVDKGKVRRVLSRDFAPTDLSIRYASNPSFSGGAETDIVYQEGSAGIDDDADGRTWCNDKLPRFRCDQQYVRIRGNGAYTYGLACHETGHAVGLVHGRNAQPAVGQRAARLGCMKTPVEDAQRLDGMNKRNINRTYPLPSLQVASSAEPAAQPHQKITTAHGSDRRPSHSASDWVTYADHVVAVTAVGARELRPSATELERGEGLIGRTVTLRVDQVIWSREGAPQAPAGWERASMGWEFTGGDTGDRATMVPEDAPRVEPGHRYIMAIQWERDACSPGGGKWFGLGEGSTVPYDDGVIGQGEFGGRVRSAAQAMAAAGADGGLEDQMAGKSTDALGQALRAAEPGTRTKAEPTETECD